MTRFHRTPLARLLLAAVAAAALAGCASRVPLDEGAAANAANANGGVLSGAASNGGVASVNSSSSNAGNTAGVESVLASQGRTVLFDLDSYTVSGQYTPLLQAVARALNADKSAHLVLEGHTDERGGTEYNLALGQRRADAVLQQLRLLGVSDAQLEAVSYGKERPADPGHDEAAWAKNRRVDMR
ncbi:peptidoglycan-associated lipoprotein Pal [Amphibiibacter pelophylacis]|uniref:Peptidoglycan-associated lipoprotein Pal n=1 Tax=Amphibiibacter pelophylacis TaxID=1799477 RepID=A0ACC6P4J0_9BURK